MTPAATEQDRAWRAARARMKAPAGPAAPNVVRIERRAIASDAIHLGDDDKGPIGVDLQKLMEGRLLVQGVSGAGKSWTLRRLLEETAGAVQQIVIDPEDEFGSYAEAYGMLSIDAAALDPAAIALAAARAREHRLSVRFDVSDMEREARLIAVTRIFSALVEAPREHWHPLLVAVDEVHLFAPYGGEDLPPSIKRAAVGALVDIMGRGRKRGIAGVLATRRLARLAASVRSEPVNFLIGQNTLDLDIRRAGDTIGWARTRAEDILPTLAPGDFVAVGPAFVESPVRLHVGPVQTEHRGAAPAISEAPVVEPGEASRLIDLDELIAQSAADEAMRAEGSYAPGLKARRAMVRDPGFAPAGVIFAALAPLYPEGASIAGMAAQLGLADPDFDAGLALLDDVGALEFLGEGRDRVVRIARGMQP